MHFLDPLRSMETGALTLRKSRSQSGAGTQIARPSYREHSQSVEIICTRHARTEQQFRCFEILLVNVVSSLTVCVVL